VLGAGIEILTGLVRSGSPKVLFRKADWIKVLCANLRERVETNACQVGIIHTAVPTKTNASRVRFPCKQTPYLQNGVGFSSYRLEVVHGSIGGSHSATSLGWCKGGSRASKEGKGSNLHGEI
jgi:hypothetical protein